MQFHSFAECHNILKPKTTESLFTPFPSLRSLKEGFDLFGQCCAVSTIRYTVGAQEMFVGSSTKVRLGQVKSSVCCYWQ